MIYQLKTCSIMQDSMGSPLRDWE